MLGNILKKYHYQNTKMSYLKMNNDVSKLIGLPSSLSEVCLENAQRLQEELILQQKSQLLHI